MYVYGIHEVMRILAAEKTRADGPGMLGLPTTPDEIVGMDSATLNDLFTMHSADMVTVFPEVTETQLLVSLSNEVDVLRRYHVVLTPQEREDTPVPYDKDRGKNWSLHALPFLTSFAGGMACYGPGIERVEGSFANLKRRLRGKPRLDHHSTQALMHLEALQRYKQVMAPSGSHSGLDGVLVVADATPEDTSSDPAAASSNGGGRGRPPPSVAGEGVENAIDV
eukprot:GHVU01086970.1.p1 GENE.GHVU01086970.1~~GHVU01086970.1.p1  ORF type:complete len:223 (-),score=32.26 GHVU01086970.1:1619-2287(-)